MIAAPYRSFYEASRQHYLFALQRLFSLPDSFVSEKNITVSGPDPKETFLTEKIKLRISHV